MLLAFLVGGSLGTSGAALQALVATRSRPDLLGISGGAGLAAVIAIALGMGDAWGIPVAAFAGGLGAVAWCYSVDTVAGRRSTPMS